ncbi:MAG: hypothetical protein PSX80_01755 [bacterium]|nr:hypothetical protein [bacterium]
MRNWFAILVLFSLACGDIPDDRSVQPPPSTENAFEQQTIAFEMNDLAPATRKQFALILPTDAREVLENADVLELSINQQRIRLTNPNVRQRLLLAIYQDAVASIESKEEWNAVNCVENTHTISATTTNRNQLIEKVRLSLSYNCGKIFVSGLLGDLPEEWNGRLELKRSESKKVFDEIARSE